ncbi:MAG: Wzz/FepE/Etk N-terminal domain-containing protein, partial [Candidatus Eisenbacteria bacterium]
MESGRVTFYHLLSTITKWRRFVFRTTFVICVVAAAVLFLLPNWYTATTSILPPERETSFMGLATSFLQGIGMAGGQEMVLPAFATPSHVYASILKSRTAVEAVVRKHGLKDRYKSKTMDDAVKECLTHTRVKVGAEGLVTLSFEDTDRQRAADVANSFVERLNTINQQVSSSRAGSTRGFLEERLAETTKTLKASEDSLRRFQEKNKAISIDAQMEAQI